MGRFLTSLMILVALLTSVTLADEAQDEAIKKDRKLGEGTWRVVSLEVDGNSVPEEETKKFTLLNAADGSWSFRVDDKDIAKGTSVIDPSKKPKAVTYMPTDGEGAGQDRLGIYEVSENTQTFCFAAAGKERPGSFASPSGSQNILMTLERVK